MGKSIKCYNGVERLKARMRLLDSMRKESRQILDNTKGLSDLWFPRFQAWKEINQRYFRTKVELSIIQNQGEL